MTDDDGVTEYVGDSLGVTENVGVLDDDGVTEYVGVSDDDGVTDDEGVTE